MSADTAPLWPQSCMLNHNVELRDEKNYICIHVFFIIIYEMASSAIQNLVFPTFFCLPNGLANIKLLRSLPATESTAGLHESLIKFPVIH